ncbi:Holliday junction DNA helicase RuvA [Candidatus Roizmanbacteria bacterium RIFCSPHIGHO2_01_FULL_39_8]|uniref:Holliday junction branch migration complex subunit RuvA n=2 Tax=Candidatus Roizmaniibacteriota TaxID=1752723 RepID=A0A1F7GSY3_9BACT|nr:MAG: Holliday junction DNA helicase RuvA [Candidatus Roizmanbacteria bacterium RIFCSPHIGHO2_01_FULL_39_8]OGK28210.1 MAG: Holliday junction DNA helicase RuvA [Candidatus Roizmanbacteria bacterium RIFCSPHIGHO2_02_FULL_39_9]
MIGKLKGTIVEVEGNIALLETNSGVFYELFLTPTLLGVKKIPYDIELYTYLQVRDDALVLFGFQTKKEYSFFKMLLSVPGVGPKTAYSVISYSKIDDMIKSIKENNSDYFTRIPGLGKKTAMKIILELSQKLESEFKLEKMFMSDEDKTIIDALVSLGFKSIEAKKIVRDVPKDLSLEERIKEAIRSATNPRR